MKFFLTIVLTSLLACISQAQPVKPVRFAWGTTVFPANFETVRQKNDIEPREIVNGKYVRYIQCAGIPSAADRAVCESSGVQFLGYVSFGAYLVSIPARYDLSGFVKLEVRSMIPVPGTWKTARSLREPPFGAWAVHGDMLDLNLQVYPHVGIARGAELCRKYGMTVLKEGNQNGFLSVRAPKENLEAISALPFVQYLELISQPGKKEDTKSRALNRAGLIDSDFPSGKHYNGQGVNVLVRDDGVIGPHIDFQGRLTNLTDVTGNGDHGDWVAGALAAAGNLDPAGKGMAAGAGVFAIEYSADFQDQTLALFQDRHVTLTNSSYSDGCNDGYTLNAQTVDQQIFQNPALLHVFSAGNNGSTDCNYGAGAGWGTITGGHKMAKNALAVASLNEDGSSSPSSSRGPAYDGRLIPELSAQGANVYMTQPDNSYSSSSGTSFASPAVVGCLAQLSQAFKTLNNGQDPSSTLLRAVVFNTANDIGKPGPDFRFGWGYPNAYRALQVLEDQSYQTGQADQGVTATQTVHISSGQKQVRFMIVWADPPAVPYAAKALVNDLDLTVKSPDGTIHLPWRPDPTPNPVKLDAPATPGRDSLNNAEQVAIDNPAEGDYLISVHGTEIPFGPQTYTFVWTVLPDKVKITYPAGGEGLVPGETARIHWDAFGNAGSFSLRFSADNGNTWNTTAVADSSTRSMNWAVPNVISGACRLLLIRGNLQDTSPVFSIAPIPAGLTISRVCPDSMTVTWTKPNDTLRYDVYLLGNRYMEIAGSSNTGSFTFPIPDAGMEQWLSVRSADNSGLAGRRAIAIRWPGGLKNCQQDYDLGVRRLLSPDSKGLVSCGPVDLPVSVKVKNEGLNAVNGALIHYQMNAQPPVDGSLPSLAAGDSVVYTFPALLHIDQNGIAGLKIWSDFGPDAAHYNDTLKTRIPFATMPLTTAFTEDFESSAVLPFGWSIGNPDQSLTWTLSQSTLLIGANGNPTRAVYLNCYDYPAAGQEDYLYMPPLDLGALPGLSLAFDLAYAPYGDQYADSLRVDIYPACNLNATPVTIWGKSGGALATDLPTTDSYVPANAYAWRHVFVDLQPFAGQSVVVRFASVNAYGNNIYLDNIGLRQDVNVLPDAGFSASADTVCRLDTVVFQALTTHPLQTGLTWNFGAQAQPATGSGPGPIPVRYLTSGAKTVFLVAATSSGSDTMARNIAVLNLPVADFTYSSAGLTVSFINASQFGLVYNWDFGDGLFSLEANPVHTYAAPGTYTVHLTVKNSCSSVVKTASFSLVSGVQDLAGLSGVRILPNPTEGDFRVDMQVRGETGIIRLQLLDATGKLIRALNVNPAPSIITVPFTGLQLPKGIYQLNIETDHGAGTFRIAVQ